MALADVLKHTGRVYQRSEFDAWVDGQPDVASDAGTTFPCVVFPSEGQMLHQPGAIDLERGALAFVVADELNEAAGLPDGTVRRWLVTDIPQAFGRPGAPAKVVVAHVEYVPYNAFLKSVGFLGSYDDEDENPVRWTGSVPIFYDDGVGTAESSAALVRGGGTPSPSDRVLVLDEPVAESIAIAPGANVTFEYGDFDLVGVVGAIERRAPTGSLVSATRLLLDDVREADA